jgi:hypothetical protein
MRLAGAACLPCWAGLAGGRKVEALDGPGRTPDRIRLARRHRPQAASKHFGFHGDYRYTFLEFHGNNDGGLIGRVLTGHRRSMWTLGTTFYF